VNAPTQVVQARGDWTVARLNEEIVALSSGRNASPCDQLRLLYNTRELSSSDTLTQAGVKSDGSVQCALQLLGGKKTKSKGGKSHKKGARQDDKGELIFKEDGQMYAQVVSMLGSSRMKVVCDDGKERTCKIRGKLIRRAWVSSRDIVLVTLRDYEKDDDKCDMVAKYSQEEARRLISYKELPQSMALKEDGSNSTTMNEEDNGIEFTWDADDEIDIDNI